MILNIALWCERRAYSMIDVQFSGPNASVIICDIEGFQLNFNQSNPSMWKNERKMKAKRG